MYAKVRSGSLLSSKFFDRLFFDLRLCVRVARDGDSTAVVGGQVRSRYLVHVVDSDGSCGMSELGAEPGEELIASARPI
jgi:hypothetical protein